MLKLTPLKWFVVLAVIAVGLALGLPPDPQAVQHLHTTQASYRLAIAALLIPYILIWYASFFSFAKLQEYSKPLKDTKDGAAFRKITIGMGTLAFSLVVPTIIMLILSNIASHQSSFGTTAGIINNYLGLFPGMIAFLLLYNGARQLLGTVSKKAGRLDIRWHAPWFLLLSATFSHLAIENQYRWDSYHLAVWLLITTYVVPFLYGWAVGLLSAHDFNLYAQIVRGTLYRQAIKQFAIGITVVITGSIAIQFVNITLAHRANNSLGFVLLIDYLILIIIAAGLILMARGTMNLKKIEEV